MRFLSGDDIWENNHHIKRFHVQGYTHNNNRKTGLVPQSSIFSIWLADQDVAAELCLQRNTASANRYAQK